jgi:hypothetical protein
VSRPSSEDIRWAARQVAAAQVPIGDWQSGYRAACTDDGCLMLTWATAEIGRVQPAAR